MLALAIYGLLGAAGAYPVLRHPIARLWGDSGDAWQNLWNGWWWGEALTRGRSPFDCDLLWHPDGIDLWLHTLGPVNAAATAIGQAIFPGFLGFNLLVFAQLLFGALTGFWLVRVLIRRAFPELAPRSVFGAALLGGFAFGFSPYVWGHAAVHLHLASVGVVGLFVLFLERALRGARHGILGMGLLALLTALTGWYLLIDEALLGVVFVGAALLRLRCEGRGPLLRLVAGGLLAGVLVAPLLWQVLAASAEPLGGAHDPRIFALDLLSPFVPSATQAIGAPFREITGRFSGNAAENATALGFAALALCGVAVFTLRRRLPGRYLAAGLLGLLVSTGPDLKLGGASFQGLGIFYRALEAVAPPLEGLGCPVRFALLANLAVAVGAGLGIAALQSRAARSRRRFRPGASVVAVLLGLALLVEFWPAPPATSRYPTPAFLDALARDTGPLADGLAVADLTGWTHPLYNQTLHGRPIVHGYTSRRPLRLLQKLEHDPVLGPLFGESLHGRAPRVRALVRREEAIGFDLGTAAPAPGVARDFEATLRAVLIVPTSGAYTFTLGADDGATLVLDGVRVIDNGGVHAYRERDVTRTLEQGEHPLRIDYRDVGGRARLSLRLSGPGLSPGPVATGMLRTPVGAPGVEVSYFHRAARPRLAGPSAWAHLRKRWGVGWVIAYADRAPAMLEGALGLQVLAREEGMVLYRVPEP